MQRVEVSEIVQASAEQVWKVIGDYNNIHVFHPFVEKAVQMNDKASGLGAVRQCNLYNNTSVLEEVVAWDEGRSFTVKNQQAPLVGEIEGGMRLEPINTEITRVTIFLSYTPKWGIIGKLLNALLLKFAFKSVLNKVLASLKHHIETGEKIGKGGKPISSAC